MAPSELRRIGETLYGPRCQTMLARALPGSPRSVRNWVAGLLAGLATLFLMVGGLRYLVAAGNRREMERGKEAMKSAVVGYVLAVMAPLLIDLLRRMVGI